MSRLSQPCFSHANENFGGFGLSLIRLFFIAADGTEYELRDQLNDGSPLASYCTNYSGASRGKVFKSADGTAVTFISDTNITDNYIAYPSGHLMMRDGTRFRIDFGNVTWMQDRNGNKVSFSYDGQQRVTAITDSLNRQFNISYYNPPSQTYDSITWKGYNNTQREIRVYYAALSTVLRSDFSTGTMIFNPTGDSSAGDTGGYNFDTQTVVSQVLLPNNQSYYFKYNPQVELAEVTLPTGGKYQYDWDAGPGTYPGADGEDGEWGVPPGWPTPFNPDYTGAIYAYRRVTERRVRPDGSTLEGSTTYSVGGNSSGSIITVNHLDASQTVKAQDKHYFYGSPFSAYNAPPTSYAPWKEGREYQTDANDTDGNLLRRVIHTWQQRAAVTWYSTDPANPSAPPQDPRITDTTATLADVSPNPVAKQTFAYDQYNNKTDTWEYDYGAGAPPAYATRHAHIDYLGNTGFTTNPVNGAVYDNPPPVSATDTFIHLRSLPVQQTVYAVNPSTGAETWAAQTVNEYDRYDASTNHAALVNRANISGLDSAFTTGYTTRGNTTRVDRWLNNSGSLKVSAYAQFDIAGNPVKAIDARNYATDFDFTDRFGAPDGDARANAVPTELSGLSSFAFATKVTNALSHTAYTQFDYYLGSPVDSEDPNGVKASLYYADALDRPTKKINAVGAIDATQARIYYDDTNRVITAVSDKDTLAQSDNINGSGLKSATKYDGLGRSWRAGRWHGSQWEITDTEFDALGRPYHTSNPYTADNLDGAVNPPGLWVTKTYDTLSRVTAATTPDNATVTTAYNGNQVAVTDQTSKKRMSESDALGRLKKVWEVTAADVATVSVTFPGQSFTAGYLTNYAYDTLDNLTTVTQQAGTSGTTQTRSFVYDPLKRLTSAANPESGTTSYTYDNNSNLATKTDARSLTTTYGYNALNRNTSVLYSSYPNGSGYIERVYDLATNGKGRLYYSISYNYRWDGDGKPYWHADATTAYDGLGRPTNKWQGFILSNAQQQATTWQQYNLARAYNKAGAVTSQTYPSNRAVSYGYDGAGRLNSFTGNIGDGVSRTYATNVTYTAAGQMAREQFGTATALYHKQHYNSRLQMASTRLSTVNDEYNWNRGAIINFYGTNAANNWDMYANDTDNNGNLRRQVYYVPDNDAISAYAIPELHDFAYDALNRVTSVNESQMNASSVWTFGTLQQAYSYDRWGNRTINTGATWNAPNPAQTVDTATNRMTASGSASLSYDVAGNQTSDDAYARWYDAENRLNKATAVGGTSYYYYNAEGQRMRRVVNGVETWLVYGFEGELVAEYPVSGTFNGSNPPTVTQKEYGYRSGQLLVVGGCDTMRWLVGNHLGTPRMEADTTGSLAGIKRHDYLPFGEELFGGGSSQRTTARGYTTLAGQDCIRQQYGGYERDNETGLDFAEARYLSSVQGRFTSVDPLGSSGELQTPQSLNRYSYVLNNPLNSIDPTGLYTCRADGTCVGDFNGEINGNLRWNEYQRLWVTEREYQTVKAVERIARDMKRERDFSRFQKQDAQAMMLPFAMLGGNAIRFQPQGSGEVMAVGLLALGALNVALNWNNLPPPLPIGPPTIITTTPPLTLPAPLNPNTFTKAHDGDLVKHIAEEYGVNARELARLVEEVKRQLRDHKGKRPDKLPKDEIEDLAKSLGGSKK